MSVIVPAAEKFWCQYRLVEVQADLREPRLLRVAAVDDEAQDRQGARADSR